MSTGRPGSGASRRRLALWLVLALGVVLIALLATGLLARHTGGSNNQVATGAATVTTPEAGGGGGSGNVSADNWGTYGGTYDETRHSALTQIDKANVSSLGRAFTVDFRKIDPSIPNGQQSFPIVIDGVIYVTTSNDHVFAVDGGSGKVLWHFRPTNTGVYANYGVNANRGVAVCDGKVFLLTLDMRIVALDQKTGKQIANVPISDAVPGAQPQFGYSETQAPICYRNTVVIGASGSDYGARGFVMAYTTDLTPAWPSPYWIIPPEGKEWRQAGPFVGGATNWNPVTIDAQTGTIYLTTSNASPLFLPELRPGADPRSDAVVALDLATGRQLWWQQQLSFDEWGYSTVQPVLLYDVKIGGVERRVVSVATKEGTWFMYDARTGAPIYTRVQLLNHIEHSRLVPGKPVVVYPGSIGGLNYSPSSFDPGTGYVVNSEAETAAVLQQKSNVAQVNAHKVSGDVDNGLANGSFGVTPHGWHDYGSISAVDAATGRLAWKLITPEPGRGGVTTTATGLGFAGGGDGTFLAFDTATGHQLWSFQTGHQIASGPSIYEDHGKEFVAITVGGTATSSFGGTASQLQVFALDGSTVQSSAPQLRPPSAPAGLYSQPTQFLSLSSDPHTISLLAIASYLHPKGDDNIDGTEHGAMTVIVPQGWRANVSFGNHAEGVADGVAVVPLDASGPVVGTPAFKGATSSGSTTGGVGYFSFTASRAGDFALASTVASRAAGGEWIHFDVVSSTSRPKLRLGGYTYVLTVAQ
jgi:alcohol dehydrogenase (cytochrome c)